MTKIELRKVYLEKRNVLSEDERRFKSRNIAIKFFENVDLVRVKTLHSFIPIAKFNEVDTSFIFEKIWDEFPYIKTVVPRIFGKDGEMENVAIQAISSLKENAWGIREPVGGEIVDATDIDMVLVPLLCFDKKGHRIGYGKGFYDRFLSQCRANCLKIGLSYFPPVGRIIGADEHDIKLDKCISPQKIFDF